RDGSAAGHAEHRTERVHVDGAAGDPRLDALARVGTAVVVEVGGPATRCDEAGAAEVEEVTGVLLEPREAGRARGPGQHQILLSTSWPAWRSTRVSASAAASRAIGAVTVKVTDSPGSNVTSMSSTRASGWI